MAQVAFRADASSAIGAGHVMRCLALAETLRAKGAESRFLCREAEGDLCDAIATQWKFPVDRLPGEDGWESDARASAARAKNADWIVVDHYGLDARWEEKLRAASHRVLAIDDKADRPHACDLLLDQNLHPDAERRYRPLVPAGARLLLGPSYALLRSEFKATRAPEARPQATRVLVTLGGSAQPRVLAAAKEGLAGFEVRITTGADRMAELMSWADMALSGGGVTALELACMGVPALLVVLSEDQRANVTALAAAGLAVDLGNGDAARIARQAALLAADPARRARMSDGLRRLVDGRGAERVAQALA